MENRIDQALRLRAMKQTELAERTGISIHTINPWIHNKWQPKATALNKMAKVLDVAELWLAGYDVPMERPLEQKQMDQVAETMLQIKANKRYTDLFNYIVELDDNKFVLVEQLVKELSNND